MSNPQQNSLHGKNILITGASGFIGGFLVEEALNRGCKVWAGIRKGSNKDALRDKRINFIDLAYHDQSTLIEQIKEQKSKHGVWDFVIHNAGVTKSFDPKQYEKVNASYTKALINALIEADSIPTKFALMSSLSSYGMGDEENYTPIKPTDKQNPNTLYGKSKLMAENMLREQKLLPYVIIRPTGVYGPGDKDYAMAVNAVRKGISVSLGLKEQRLSFIYVKDLCRAVFMALESAKAINKEYLVAAPDVYTDREYAELIKKVLGKKHTISIRIPMPLVRLACIASGILGKLLKRNMTLNADKYVILSQRNWLCDTQNLQDDLGFSANYSLQKGLEETIHSK